MESADVVESPKQNEKESLDINEELKEYLKLAAQSKK
jgi:hypothetical protein